MKPIRWSAHARNKAAAREVSGQEVEKTVAQPDSVVPGQPPRQIYMRRYVDAVLKTEMFLREAMEETADELAIVTLYKTSDFKKYEEKSRL